MALTVAEQKELDDLDARAGESVVGGLTTEEAVELAALDARAGTQEGPPPSMLESAGRGLAQGASLGLADEGTAVVESVAGSLGLVPDKTYKQSLQESQAAYKRAESSNPSTYLAGELAGGIPAGIGAGYLAKKGAAIALPKLGGAIGSGLAKAGEITESLVDRISKITKASPDTVKDVAALVLDSQLGGQYATTARVLKRAGKLTDILKKDTGVAKEAEEAVVDTISKKMSGWDFPVRKK